MGFEFQRIAIERNVYKLRKSLYCYLHGGHFHRIEGMNIIRL